MQRKWLGNVATAVLFGASLFANGAVVQAQEEAEVAPVEEESDWTDALSVSAFVDANVSVTSQKSGTATAAGIADGQSNHRSYVSNNGFNLSFAGVDASLMGEQFGGTISLRFGPSVIQFFGDNSPLGFGNLTQAYVTWMPHDKITFDLGQFGTIYGAEVAESWQNMNYTRGALYFAMQPFWHTGLRTGVQLTDNFGLTALVVNGTNDILEFSNAPSVGLQAALTLDSFELYVGWMGDIMPENDANNSIGAGGLFDNFFDVVATASAGDFSIVANADVGISGDRSTGEEGSMYYGVSVAPGYAFTDWLGAAARIEYLGYPDNTDQELTDDMDGNPVGGIYESLLTMTATVDVKPVPNRANLILRPEFRYEMASEDVFLDRDDNTTNGWWVLTMGAVVTTDG